jgi:AraC-like DNA-binding protein
MTVQVTTIEDDDPGRTARHAAPAAMERDPARDEHREAAVRDLLRLLEANRRLRDTLADNAVHYEASLRAMLDGSDPGRVIDGVDVARCRLGLADSLAEFERARHKARGTFIVAQFDDGMNMKEISRRWGISRQLAHRFFKESRRDA